VGKGVTVHKAMERSGHSRVDLAVSIVAGVFALLYAGYFLTVRDVTDVNELQAFFEMTLFGVAVVVLFGSVWLTVRTDARPRLERRLLWWAVGGIGFMLLVNVSMLAVVSPGPDFEDTLLQVLLSGGFGMAAGLVMGVLEIRASQQERARVRSELTAQRREQERQRLELLNQYLRHEILNKVQIVRANADLLLREGEDSERRLATIVDRSDDLSRFVQSIRSILQASDHEPSLEPVDLGAVAAEEAEKLERSFEAVTVVLDVPAGVTVEADTLLGTVVSNLLENAAEHGAETIELTATRAEETVTLRVSDDGPGVPPPARDSLFDPPESGDHGYGLFLVRNLVELYDGRVRLVETGADGTTFEVTLARHTDEEPWRAGTATSSAV
jgi:signal transduction histidine kinase